MNIATIFFGLDSRLRSGWRVLLFTLGFLFIATVGGGLAFAVLFAFLPNAASGSPLPFIAGGVSFLIAALVVGWLCGKYLDGVPFRALGAAFSKNWIKNLVAGLFLGGLTFAVAAGLGTLSGGLRFQFNTEASNSEIHTTLAISFLIFFIGAAWEEALFRGYILQTIVRSDLTWFAVLLTSTLFATVHNANPSATLLSWLNTFIAGIWFAVAYLKTRDLWLPFGQHLAWNWTQGSIFGVEVSGLTEIVKAPLMRETDAGPVWITGGDYGIEGGIVTTIALAASTILIAFLPSDLLPGKEASPHRSEPPA